MANTEAFGEGRFGKYRTANGIDFVSGTGSRRRVLSGAWAVVRAPWDSIVGLGHNREEAEKIMFDELEMTEERNRTTLRVLWIGVQ